MSLLGKANFLCQWPLSTVKIVSCHSWPTYLFSFVHFSFFSFASTETVISLSIESSFLAISTSWCGYCYRCHAHSLGLFIFRVLVCHYQLVDLGHVVCVGLILPFRSIRQLPWCCIEWLSTYLVKVVALHLDNSTAKAYLCNLDGTVSPVLSRLSCWILSTKVPTSIVLFLFQRTFLPIWMWRLIICHRVGCFWSGIFLPQMAQVAFCLFGSTRGGSAYILPYNSMPALLHIGNTTTSGDLGIECLQPSFEVSGKVCVSSCISSSSSVQVCGRTCHRSTQTFDSHGAMLDGGFFASHISQHIGRHSLVVSLHKRSHHGLFW